MGVFFAFSFLVMMFDYIELLRRTRSRDDIGFGLISKMVLMHLPNTAQQLVPFVILFSVILMLWRLGRTSQLVIIRAAGASIWQILTPIFTIIALYVALDFAVINPLGALMMERFEKIDRAVLRGKKDILTVSSTGLWLRQQREDGYGLVKIGKVYLKENKLENVTIYNFSDTYSFLNRIDTKTALLYPGYWDLNAVQISSPNQLIKQEQTLRWETSLDIESMNTQYLSPDTLSFWELTPFIKVIENAGLSSVKYKVYWNNTLSRPLLLFAMVILAAICVYRVMQRRQNFTFVLWGIGIAFVLYVFYNVMTALGNSVTIPVVLATWSAPIISLLLMLAFLMHLEEK